MSSVPEARTAHVQIRRRFFFVRSAHGHPKGQVLYSAFGPCLIAVGRDQRTVVAGGMCTEASILPRLALPCLPLLCATVPEEESPL